MNNEIEVLQQFFAALNRNDMQGITTYFDPQIVRIEPEGFPTAGTYPWYRGSPRAPYERTRDMGRGNLRAREIFDQGGQSRCLSPCSGPPKGLA
jgi:ketosteroid isomerase-like protein